MTYDFDSAIMQEVIAGRVSAANAKKMLRINASIAVNLEVERLKISIPARFGKVTAFDIDE